MKKFPILLLLTACWSLAAAQERPQVPAAQKRNLRTEIIAADSTGELLAQLRNMPNIEIGKGITFRPKNDWFELTMRFRMQNLLALSFDDDFTLTKTEARVKRLRLRFDGYIYSPKLVYSVQLGFTSYDTELLPGGDMNIVRDAIVYYVPNATWNIGFGQTKIKANRARINSSSALQFVDRSIVNSEFNLDRDFGLFGEYNPLRGEGFNLSAKASVTLGEGRNWGSSSGGGLAYTGRVELYPLGRFGAKGDPAGGRFRPRGAGAHPAGRSLLLQPQGRTPLWPARRPDAPTAPRGTSAPTSWISSSNTADSPSTPISWAARAATRSSIRTATPSSTTAAASTCKPATCSAQMGGRAAQLDALSRRGGPPLRRIRTLEPDLGGRDPLYHRTQSQGAGRRLLQPPQPFRSGLQPLGNPLPARTRPITQDKSGGVVFPSFRNDRSGQRIFSAIRAQASASASA